MQSSVQKPKVIFLQQSFELICSPLIYDNVSCFYRSILPTYLAVAFTRKYVSNGRIECQRTQVRIQSSARFIEHFYCLLFTEKKIQE